MRPPPPPPLKKQPPLATADQLHHDWRPFDGSYLKLFYDVRRDGRVYKHVWPNGGQLTVFENGRLVAVFIAGECEVRISETHPLGHEQLSPEMRQYLTGQPLRTASTDVKQRLLHRGGQLHCSCAADTKSDVSRYAGQVNPVALPPTTKKGTEVVINLLRCEDCGAEWDVRQR